MKAIEFIKAIIEWDGVSKRTFELDLAAGEAIDPIYLIFIKEKWTQALILKLCYAGRVNFTFNVGASYPISKFEHFTSILSLLHNVHLSAPTSSESKDRADKSIRHKLLWLILEGAVDQIDPFIEQNYRQLDIDTPPALSEDKFSSIAKQLYSVTLSRKYEEILQKLIVWEQPDSELVNRLKMEREDIYLPRTVVWAEELTLEYSANPRPGRPKRKPCEIPDPIDKNSGLTLHEVQLIEEAVFSRRRYGYPKFDDKDQEMRSDQVDNLSDIFDYPWASELPGTNFIVANIGLVISKKYASDEDSFGKFITFPIEDNDYALITKAQASSPEKNPHGEVTLYAYMKSMKFKQWFVKKLREYAESNKDEHNETIKCYAIVIDLHSSNTMCDTVGCQALTLDEQHAKSPGNVNDVIKECLKTAGFQIPKHNLLRMVTRVSSHQGDNWASERDKKVGAFYKFNYQEYKKDIRYLISKEAKQYHATTDEKKKPDEMDLSTDQAPPVNAFILHQVNKRPAELRKKINKECKEISLLHTTIFKNGIEWARYKKSEFAMPAKLPIHKPIHLRDIQECLDVKEPEPKKSKTL